MRFTYPDCSNDLIAGTAIESSVAANCSPATPRSSDPRRTGTPLRPLGRGSPRRRMRSWGTNNRSIVRTGVNRPNVLARADRGHPGGSRRRRDLQRHRRGDQAMREGLRRREDDGGARHDRQPVPLLQRLVDAPLRRRAGARDAQRSSSRGRAHAGRRRGYEPQAGARVVLRRGRPRASRCSAKRSSIATAQPRGASPCSTTRSPTGRRPGPITFSPHAQRIGVKISLSGGDAGVACTDVLVVCYGSETNGLTRVRGWATPSGSGVALGAVDLFNKSGLSRPGQRLFQHGGPRRSGHGEPPGIVDGRGHQQGHSHCDDRRPYRGARCITAR